jgi:hypothetical protein
VPNLSSQALGPLSTLLWTGEVLGWFNNELQGDSVATDTPDTQQAKQESKFQSSDLSIYLI